MKHLPRGGFTLLELLIVIAIIGLIATFAAFSFQSSRLRSRDTKRVADLTQVQKALELGFNQGNGYPIAASSVNLGDASHSALCGKDATIGFVEDTSAANCDTDKIYMGLIPSDPLSPSQEYEYVGTASTYCIETILEVGSGGFVSGGVIADEASLRNGSCP